MYHLFLQGCKYCALKGVARKGTIYRRQKMKELDKAIKTYWYSRGFNKVPDTCGCYQMELDAFSEGFKVALEWVLGINSIYSDCNRECFNLQDIRKELNATSEKRC